MQLIKTFLVLQDTRFLCLSIIQGRNQAAQQVNLSENNVNSPFVSQNLSQIYFLQPGWDHNQTIITKWSNTLTIFDILSVDGSLDEIQFSFGGLTNIC